MPNNDRESFAQKLYSLHKQFYDDDFDVEKYNEEIMDAFLKFIGDTEESRKCTEIIEFGGHITNFDADKIGCGFKLKRRSYTYLSGILNTLERIPIPDSIEFQDIYPDMTQEEWESAMMMCSSILLAFEPHKPIKK